MTWFLVALIGPFLYAMTNHIDKHLLGKYFKEGGVGTLMMFSSLLSVLILPVVFIGEIVVHGYASVLSIGLVNTLALCATGLLYALLVWSYLKALEEAEASVTIVFYQLVPVIGYILGYFILGETLSQMQLIAMGIIIFGTSIIAIEMDSTDGFKIRRRTSIYMTTAATCWALSSVIFKAVALEENVWVSLFWENAMLVIVGIFFFVFIPTYRQHFLSALKNNSAAILSLNVTNEVLYMTGNAIVAFAFLMAPISLVLLTESFQPIFVLAIGVFLTIFFPNLGSEKIEARHLAQKIIAITITGIGTYLLLSA